MPSKKRALGPADVQSLARSYTRMAIRVLVGVATNGRTDAAKVAAASVLLDRGYGKVPQTLDAQGLTALRIELIDLSGDVVTIDRDPQPPLLEASSETEELVPTATQ